MPRISRLPAKLALLAISATLCALGQRATFADDTFPDIKPAPPVIPDKNFKLTDFGGVGDGKTVNTAAFAKAIDEINKQGGGRLTIPKGEFITGPFKLCSHLDLHLDAGAIIESPATFAANGFPEISTFKTQKEVSAAVKPLDPLISGTNLEDVAITGDGIIDGKGQVWWDVSERAIRQGRATLFYPRAKLIVIKGCKRMHVSGVTLQNSPMFHLGLAMVSDVLVEHIKVLSPWWAPNTDAIDPGPCENVVIRDCYIDTGDDDIAVKGSGKVDNLLIDNCEIKHGHGISVGSETAGGIKNMYVRHCTFDGTEYGLRIKSMRGAGGAVTHVRYNDIHLNNVEVPILFDLTYVDNNRPNFKGDPTKIPSISDVVGQHIIIENCPIAGRFFGLPDGQITDVHFRDIEIEADKPFEMKDAADINFEHLKLKIKSPSTQPTTKFIE